MVLLSRALVVACLLCVTTALWAQPADAPPSPDAPAEGAREVSEETKERAREHFRRGLTLLREEAWAPALAEFLRSRELYPTRVATNNAGVALRKLQRYDEAIEMFETLLRDFEVGTEERDAAQKQIAELRSLVGTVEIRGAEPGASIVISSLDRGEYPPVKPLRVPAGTHVVRVFKEGYEPFESRVDVAGGEIAVIDVTLSKLTASGKLKVLEQSGRNVTVVVDGMSVGTTPWIGTLGVGDHVVHLRGGGKVGSPPAKAVVESQKVTTLTLLAEDLEAQLRVDPTPPGAAVAIDGVDVGNGVWLGRLKDGPHRVQVSAEGFLTAEREVTIAKGRREVVSVTLERDEDAPMWRKPSRWTFDFGAGMVILPSFGGDIADRCDDACRAAPGLGGMAMLHAGYELGSGLGFGLEAGYLIAAQQVVGRQADLAPNGLTVTHGGTADDSLRLSAFMGGVTLGYHLGEEIPVLLRTGAGVLVGQIRDERTGTFFTRAGDAYSTFPVVDFERATYFYLDPVFRVGYRFAEGLELSGQIQALLLIGLSEPRFDSFIELGAASDGIGTYPAETMMGSFVVGVAPGLNLRYDFGGAPASTRDREAD
jgi:hypothetical protein